MREWRELHRQLLLVCEELGWTAQRHAGSRVRSPLHRALLAGLPTQVGHKTEKGDFLAPRQRRYQLFPGSHAGQEAAAVGAVARPCSTPRGSGA